METGLGRINRIIRSLGVDFELELPHVAFNRRVGAFAELDVIPRGAVIDAGEWRRREEEWLPTESDRAYIRSLMPEAVTEPGRFAKGPHRDEIEAFRTSVENDEVVFVPRAWRWLLDAWMDRKILRRQPRR